MSVLRETCGCGATWTGDSIQRAEADKFREAHAACRVPRSPGCESCDDTGIYEEGAEWAPCEECALGRGFAEHLRTFAAERDSQPSSNEERLREALDAVLGICQEVAHEVEDPLQACAEIEKAARDTLEDSMGESR